MLIEKEQSDLKTIQLGRPKKSWFSSTIIRNVMEVAMMVQPKPNPLCPEAIFEVQKFVSQVLDSRKRPACNNSLNWGLAPESSPLF